MCLCWTSIIVFNNLHQTMQNDDSTGECWWLFNFPSYKNVPYRFYLGMQLPTSLKKTKETTVFHLFWQTGLEVPRSRTAKPRFIHAFDWYWVTFHWTLPSLDFIISHQAKPGCHSLVVSAISSHYCLRTVVLRMMINCFGFSMLLLWRDSR